MVIGCGWLFINLVTQEAVMAQRQHLRIQVVVTILPMDLKVQEVLMALSRDMGSPKARMTATLVLATSTWVGLQIRRPGAVGTRRLDVKATMNQTFPLVLA